MAELAVILGKSPLANVDPKSVLERYLAEETSAQIASSLGVTVSALSLFLIKHAEDDWKSSQLIKALKRKEEADTELDTASNALDIARARERLKSAQWDLERVWRRIYGQDQPAPGHAAVQINIGIRRDDATNAVQHGDISCVEIDSNIVSSTVSKT